MEVADDLSRAEWRTSSYSGTNGNCIEVAADPAARVLVRDTTDRAGAGAGVPDGRVAAVRQPYRPRSRP
jgi:hypothetical protein